MPDLHPFHALRYGRSTGELADLLAPPYDVIDGEHAKLLRARHPANAVRLVLPEGEAPGRYEQAAELLRKWHEDGSLELDPAPSVTVYRQEFPGPRKLVSRHAVFAALTLGPLDEGAILPHERTHSGPKRDRLALTLATRTQLSPVFLTARDDDASLYDALLAVAASEPDSRAATPDGVAHATWRITEPDRIRSLCSAAGAGPLLIADGHHRYETALEVKRRAGNVLPGAGRVLACVVSGRDPGLQIRPTHRSIPGPPSSERGAGWREALANSFERVPLADADPVSAAEHAEANGVIVAHAGGLAWELRPRPDVMTAAGLDALDSAVPSVVLDRLVVEGILGSDADRAARDGLLGYHRDPSEATRHAGPTGVAFLLPAVSQDAVWNITRLGRRLPPKSTYFEPKIPSGLLFRPLYGEP